jgi:outer membrane protein OmpA-like peptidoglycan-associated protein
MAEEHARELSLRRAQAVRAALIRLGVPEGQIIVRAHGTDDPMVQTASGVKEPQNRRVVVAFPDLDATQIQR